MLFARTAKPSFARWMIRPTRRLDNSLKSSDGSEDNVGSERADSLISRGEGTTGCAE
jgi:hypothetical protein